MASSMLSGTVTDRDGRPMSGAAVLALLPGRSTLRSGFGTEEATDEPLVRATTGEDGSFVLAMPVGMSVDLLVRADGFADAWRLWRSAGERLEVRLARPARLSLAVRADAGEDGMTARIRFPRSFPEVAEARTTATAETDAEGRVAFRGLEPGRWTVDIVRTGFEPVTLAVDVLEGGAIERTVTLVPGSVRAGRVVDARTGRPLRGISVHAAPLRAAPAVQSTCEEPEEGFFVCDRIPTDADGRYVVRTPAAEDALLLFEAAGRATARVRLPVSFEGSIPDVRLVEAGRVYGRVLDAAGSPLAHADVAVLSRSPAGLPLWRVETRADETGRFDATDLNPASVAWIVVRDEERTAAGAFPVDQVSRDAVVRDVEDLIPAPRGALRGTVLDDAGRRLSGALVRVELLTDEGRSLPMFGSAVRSDADGVFSLPSLPAGRAPLGLADWKGVRSARTATIVAGSTSEVHIESDGVAPGLAGRVVESEGSPVRNACVLAFGTAEGRPEMRVTDAKGRFRFEDVPPGLFSLLVQPNSLHAEGGDVNAASLRLEDVVAGVDDLEIALPPAVTIDGTVRDASGAARAGVMVFARDAGTGDLAAYERCDEEGRFVLRLRAGSIVDLCLGAPRGAPIERAIPAGRSDVVLVEPEA